MNKYFCGFLIVALFVTSTRALAQEGTTDIPIFDQGLGVSAGVGFLAIRDKYISDEEYSGPIQYYAVNWARFHETYGFRLNWQYQFTANLKNNNVTAQIDQIRIGLDYLYPLSGINVISKKVSIFFGPMCQLFVHYRSENIAQSGSEVPDAGSAAVLFSGGIRGEASFSIARNLQGHIIAQTNFVSFVTRPVGYNSNEPNSRILPLPNVVDAAAGAGITDRIVGPLSATAEYRFDLVRITSWDFFISGEDNFILSLKYNI